MRPRYLLVTNGSRSAQRASAAIGGSREWEVFALPSSPGETGDTTDTTDPGSLLDRCLQSGAGILVLPLKTAARLGDRIPEHILWLAYGSERDIQRAFFLGAADYLVDPWGEVSLIARVKRISRGETEKLGSVVLTPAGAVVLRGREKDLWEFLCLHEGRVMDRSVLADILGLSPARRPVSRGVDMAIHRLRRRLGPWGARIESVHRRGYRLRSHPCG